MLFIFVVNLFIIILAYTVNVPYNETNDDTGMSAIASGAYGTKYREYLVFQNIIIGKALKLFYNLMPEVNWYSLGQLTITFVSMCVLGYIMLEKIQEIYAFILYAAFLILFCQDFYLIYQFTRVSMICCLSGYLLTVFAFTGERSRKPAVLGIFLIILGFMIRTSGFNEVSIFAVLTGGCCVLLNRNFFPVKSHKKIWMQGILCIVVLCLLIISVYSVNQYYYDTNIEWKNFTDFNKMRSVIQDRGGNDYWPDYEQYKKEYTSYGLSENDFDMYQASVIGDTDTLNRDTVQKLYELKNRFLRDNQKSISQCVKYLLKNVVCSKIFFLNILLILLYVRLYRRSYYDILVIGNIAVYLSVYAYLYQVGRIFDRVTAPTNMTFLMVTIFCMDHEMRKEKRMTYNGGNIALIASVLICFLVSSMSAHYEELKSNRKDAAQLYNILADKSNVFVAGHDVFRWNYYFFDAYQMIPEDFYSNQINIGGWMAQTPIITEIKRENGIDNVFRALLEKDNIYLYTANSEKMISKYLSEHYSDAEVGYSVCKTVPICKFIRFSEPFTNVKRDSIDKAVIESLKTSQEIKGYVTIAVCFIAEDLRWYNPADTEFYLEIHNKKTGKCCTYYFFNNLEKHYIRQKLSNVAFVIPSNQVFTGIDSLQSDCELKLIIKQDDYMCEVPVS